MNQATIVMLLAFIMLVITTSVVMISTHKYVQAQLAPEKNASQIASELQTDACLPVLVYRSGVRKSDHSCSEWALYSV